MSYETISIRLKDILERIANVYNVHTYMRDIQNEAEFEKAFKFDGPNGNTLAAWMMTRISATTDRPALGPEAVLDVEHKIELQGFYGLEDAKESELTFQAIIDNLVDALQTKSTLQDVSGVPLAGILVAEPPQIVEIGHGQFGNHFIHFCRVILSVRERVT